MNVWPRQQGDSFRFDDTVLVEFKLWYFPEIAIEATRAQIEQKAGSKNASEQGGLQLLQMHGLCITPTLTTL